VLKAPRLSRLALRRLGAFAFSISSLSSSPRFFFSGLICSAAVALPCSRRFPWGRFAFVRREESESLSLVGGVVRDWIRLGVGSCVLWRRVARRWRQVSLLSDPAVHWFCHLDMDSVVSGSTVSRCDTVSCHPSLHTRWIWHQIQIVRKVDSRPSVHSRF